MHSQSLSYIFLIVLICTFYLNTSIEIHKNDVNILKLRQQVIELRKRIDNLFHWVHDNTLQSKKFIRNGQITSRELYILKFLKSYLDKVRIKEKEFEKLIYNPRKCDDIQSEQQKLISKYVLMDICSEVEWFKIIHLIWPEAKVLVDIGANKGYIGSLFYSLWAGSGYHINPHKISSIYIKSNLLNSSKNSHGFCQTGKDKGIPLYCPNNIKREPFTGACLVKYPGVKIHSFESSFFLSNLLNQTINGGTFDDGISLKPLQKDPIWEIHHYALSNEIGKVAFPKQSASFMPGFEGGKLIPATAALETSAEQNAQMETVEMTTLDAFLQQRGIEQVDLLKIDAEGSDCKVIEGAAQAIHQSVGVLTFEAKCLLSSSNIYDYFEDLYQANFSCYATTKAGLYKWNGGCMTNLEKRTDLGNAICANRFRVPLIPYILDILSFPNMIEHILEGNQPIPMSPRHLNSLKTILLDPREFLGAQSRDVGNELSLLYFKNRPFCSPWPYCVCDTCLS